MKTIVILLFTLSGTGVGLNAQSASMSCRDQNSGNSSRNSGANFCEIREVNLAALATLNVDGRQNGGISIKGANRADILVRAMVQAHGDSDADARSTGAQVVVHTSAGTVQADGPAQKNWSVSWEIFVPEKTNLNLRAHNGGVAIAGVESSIGFHSVNGGISLKNVAGNVHGDTVNGGIVVSLTSGHWNGQGLDISTKNGGVSLKVPETFSALLDVSTMNGGTTIKLPNVQGHSGNRLSLTLGSGGPLIRIRTENGGVTVTGISTAA